MDEESGRAAVRDTYDRIAAHFAETRAYPWPEVESFVDDCDPGGLAVDVGCGNGRHLGLLADRADRVLGLDVSRNLLAEARARIAAPARDRTALVTADAATLPLVADSVAVAVYVATLHHLPTRELRVASLDELARVLAPDGAGLVSAWSTEHDRFDESEGFDTTVDWTLPDGEVVDRYYHIYDPGEFRADLESSALAVERAFVSSGNCYARVAGRRPEGKHP